MARFAPVRRFSGPFSNMPSTDPRRILMFVKAPVAGFAKTRLSPALSAAEAAKLYHVMAQDTLTVAQQVAGASVEVAYWAHPESPDPSWLGKNLNWFPQQGRDLGERLENAAAYLLKKESRPLVIVGSDLPGLTTALLEKAFGLLARASVVLGPSEDGGYYLIGLTGLHPELFSGISWSQSVVFAQTVKKLNDGRVPYKLLPGRRDLDTAEDLRRFQEHPDWISPDFKATRDLLKAFVHA